MNIILACIEAAAILATAGMMRVAYLHCRYADMAKRDRETRPKAAKVLKCTITQGAPDAYGRYVVHYSISKSGYSFDLQTRAPFTTINPN